MASYSKPPLDDNQELRELEIQYLLYDIGYFGNGNATNNGEENEELMELPPLNVFENEDQFDVFYVKNMVIPEDANLKTPANIYKYFMIKIKRLMKYMLVDEDSDEFWDQAFNEFNETRRKYEEFLNAEVPMTDDEKKRVDSAIAMFELMEMTVKLLVTNDLDYLDMPKMRQWFIDCHHEVQYMILIPLLLGIHDAFKEFRYVNIQKILILFIESVVRMANEASSNGDERYIIQYPNPFFAKLMLDKSVQDAKILLLLDIFEYSASNMLDCEANDQFEISDFDLQSGEYLREMLIDHPVLDNNIFCDSPNFVAHEVDAELMMKFILRLCNQQEEQLQKVVEAFCGENSPPELLENNHYLLKQEAKMRNELAFARGFAHLHFAKFLPHGLPKVNHLEIALSCFSKIVDVSWKSDSDLYMRNIVYTNDCQSILWNYANDINEESATPNSRAFIESTIMRLKSGHKFCMFIRKTRDCYKYWETFLEMLMICGILRVDLYCFYARMLVYLVKENCDIAKPFTEKTGICSHKNIVRLHDALLNKYMHPLDKAERNRQRANGNHHEHHHLQKKQHREGDDTHK